MPVLSADRPVCRQAGKTGKAGLRHFLIQSKSQNCSLRSSSGLMVGKFATLINQPSKYDFGSLFGALGSLEVCPLLKTKEIGDE